MIVDVCSFMAALIHCVFPFYFQGRNEDRGKLPFSFWLLGEQRGHRELKSEKNVQFREASMVEINVFEIFFVRSGAEMGLRSEEKKFKKS